MVHRRASGGIGFAARARVWRLGAARTMHEIAYCSDGRTFELRLAPMNERTVLFNWRHVLGAPVPSLHGSITIDRFGPLTSYHIRAAMMLADDAAGKLLQQSVAPRLAGVSLRCLTRSLRAVIR